MEIKPLNNGSTAPISASVDELRATVENLSLSPIGALSVIIKKSTRALFTLLDTLTHLILFFRFSTYLITYLDYSLSHLFALFIASLYVILTKSINLDWLREIASLTCANQFPEITTFIIKF